MKKIFLVLLTVLLVACGGGDPKYSKNIAGGTRIEVIGVGGFIEDNNGVLVIRYNNKYAIADIDDSQIDFISDRMDSNNKLDINYFGMDTKFIKWEADLKVLDDWAIANDILLMDLNGLEITNYSPTKPEVKLPAVKNKKEEVAVIPQSTADINTAPSYEYMNKDALYAEPEEESVPYNEFIFDEKYVVIAAGEDMYSNTDMAFPGVAVLYMISTGKSYIVRFTYGHGYYMEPDTLFRGEDLEFEMNNDRIKFLSVNGKIAGNLTDAEVKEMLKAVKWKESK